jgi:hypothetical protein
MDTFKHFLEGHITLGTVADDGAGESRMSIMKKKKSTILTIL